MAMIDMMVTRGGGTLPDAAKLFIRDMLLNSWRTAQGKRWSPEVQALLAMVRVRCAAASDLFANRLRLPHRNTVRRHIRAHSIPIRYGAHLENMEAVAKWYDGIIMARYPDLRGRVPRTFARDETAIDGGLDWDNVHNCIHGFCGGNGHDDETHTCWQKPVPFFGGGDDAYTRLQHLVQTHRVGRRKLRASVILATAALRAYLLSSVQVVTRPAVFPCQISQRLF
jgi:hypothetical protein